MNLLFAFDLNECYNALDNKGWYYEKFKWYNKKFHSNLSQNTTSVNKKWIEFKSGFIINKLIAHFITYI